MIILSNCLTETVDEGCLKAANSLIKRLKTSDSETQLITYERESALSDVHLNINKLMINKELFSLIRKKRNNLLYFPFPARQNFTSVRMFIISLFAGKGVRTILTLNRPYNFFGKLFLKLSRAEVIVFSADAAETYKKLISKKRVTYLKTGVDTNKFTPVTKEQKNALKEKYGFNPEVPVILHVGHIKEGRNVSQMMKLSKNYQILLVGSTFTKNEQDTALREKMESFENIRIIDEYISNIEEIYQLSDVYFFPVVKTGNCIDVPLSCMEAASCNLPVVTTEYGEMRELKGKEGFYFIDDFSEETLNFIVDKALTESYDTRSSVLEYDWQNAVKDLSR